MLVLCRCFCPRRPECITSQKIPPTTMMATNMKITVLLMMVSPHLPDKSGANNPRMDAYPHTTAASDIKSKIQRGVV
jgi:hypothetical protein